MLYSIVVNLKAQADAVVPATLGYHAYALFLDVLRQANDTVAQSIHDLEGPKPFTISPLQGKYRRQGPNVGLAGGSTYSMRLTFLQEDTFAYALDGLLKAASRTLRLDQAELQIDQLLTTPGTSPLCRCQSFEDILAGAGPDRQLHMRFFSPTAFRSTGRRNVLFPEPRLLFGSCLARWQHFSPVTLDNDLPALIDKGTRIARYNLETRILNFGSYQEIGFEGTCTLELADELPERAVQALNALADFAFYSGTGAKTTMGMGQTRRVKHVGALSGRAGGHSEKAGRYAAGD